MANKSRKLLWPDEDDWLDTFRKYLCGHPELAENVAHIWVALLEHLSQGPEGLRDARTILKQALRLTYPFTASYRLAYRHYKLSLSGQVKPTDEPRILLRDSIKRQRQQIEEARKPKKAEVKKKSAAAKR
ncbi:MAG TPA: hypothetical protein VI756_31885 [Blastocatellia bacterium]